MRKLINKAKPFLFLLSKKNENGFSLIELIIAISLVSIIIFTFSGNEQKSYQSDVEESLQKVEGLIKVATNEATLKSRLVRITFDLSKKPTTYIIEVSNKENLLKKNFKNIEDVSLSERDNFLSEKKEYDDHFQPIIEFEKALPFSKSIVIEGIGFNGNDNIIDDGKVSIYVYPSGERDNSIIIFSSPYQVASIHIPTIFDEFNGDFSSSGEELSLEQRRVLADEFYKKWQSLY